MAATAMASSPPTNEAAITYLSSLLNKTLRIHTTDKRMFVGQMKCTDRERNVILAMAHEYRQPSAQTIEDAAREHESMGKSGNVRIDMLKRFVGLVVVPGEHVERIEME